MSSNGHLAICMNILMGLELATKRKHLTLRRWAEEEGYNKLPWAKVDFLKPEYAKKIKNQIKS